MLACKQTIHRIVHRSSEPIYIQNFCCFDDINAGMHACSPSDFSLSLSIDVTYIFIYPAAYIYTFIHIHEKNFTNILI